MYKKFGLLSALLATAAPAQGPVVQRSYPVGGFETVGLGGSYAVIVRTGGRSSVSARGPREAIERMVVEVRGRALRIHPRRDRWGSNRSLRGDDQVVVQVTVPALRAAAIGGFGSIRVDRVVGQDFAASIGGSGDVIVESLNVGNVKLSVGGSGTIRARSGQVRRAAYSVAGSGGIDARGVRAAGAKVSTAGSGDVFGQVRGAAAVNVVGSGSVTLTGGAQCTVSKQGSGKVRCS